MQKITAFERLGTVIEKSPEVFGMIPGHGEFNAQDTVGLKTMYVSV